MFIRVLLIMATLLISGCSVHQFGTKSQKEYQSDKPLVLFILDTSGSMQEMEGDEPKIDKAKESIIDTINQMDKSRFNASLITFKEYSNTLFDNLYDDFIGKPFRIDRQCKSKLSIAPSNDFNEISKAVESIEAYGKTPLADAIALSNKIVKNIDKKMIILLSDGKETCGGSPINEARKLYKKYGIKINLQVIGYAVDEATKRELKKISSIDKRWGYYDAKDSASLNRAINTILTQYDIRDSSIWVNANKFAFEFSTGSTMLKDEYIIKIGKIYDYLKNNKKHIIITGHTDSIGADNANMELSIQRAGIVESKLIELGIDASRIQARGEGEINPIASNDTEEGRQQNRRVEIDILD